MRSIYSGDPRLDRQHLIFISSCHTTNIRTLSFPTFGPTRSFRWSSRTRSIISSHLLPTLLELNAEGSRGEGSAASPIALPFRCNRVPNEPIPTYGNSSPQCESVCWKSETDRARRNGETAFGGRYATRWVVLTPGAESSAPGVSLMALTELIYSDTAIPHGRKSFFLMWYSLRFGFLSHSGVNSHNREARPINSSVKFHRLFTSKIGSAAIHTLALWPSMNSFRWPGSSLINTASILCYMKVSFRSFNMSWNAYLLNCLCRTWLHSRPQFHSIIALSSQSVTLPNVCAFILSKLLIALMGFQRLGAAFYSEIAHEHNQSKLNNMCHAWYVVFHCRAPNSGGLKGWF